MNRVIKTLIGTGAILAAGVSQASAQVCVLFICLGGDGGSDGGGVPAAPEIDVTQGFAALAIVVCAALLLRERFLRQRART